MAVCTVAVVAEEVELLKVGAVVHKLEPRPRKNLARIQTKRWGAAAAEACGARTMVSSRGTAGTRKQVSIAPESAC